MKLKKTILNRLVFSNASVPILAIRPFIAWMMALLLVTLPANAQDTPADILGDPALDLKRPADRAKAVAKIKTIEDARAAKTRAKAKALGLQMRTEKPGGGVMEIIDFEGDRPVYIETKNLNAAISTGANLLQSTPYGLDGTGIIAGVWDGGSVRSTHQEFANGSRVTIMDGAAASNHGTHVGGTIAAQGTSASAKGMATNVSILSYDWNSDTSEMTSQGATGPDQFGTKVYLSNHSYGAVNGWSGIQWVGNGSDQNSVDQSFGQYDSEARSLDALLFGAPYYSVFWAAGNDGTDNPSTGSTVIIGAASTTYNPAIHPPGDGVYRNGFETIASYGTAKNLITIGAANDAVTSGARDASKATLTSFSSTGPTDDGRIKPDLVANGAGLTSTASSGDTAYTTMSGTSMASPNATGSAVLVVDQYKRLFNSAMRASTLKGLLIHTATDVGNPGPDYKYGWGLMDAKRAVDLIKDHHANPAKTRITENQVMTTATTRTHSFLWDGGSPLRATLCWTDPAATAVTTHDSRTSRLVNNLNLKLIAPDGTEYFPYVMPFVGTWTVASMSQNATTGINNTDNTETVDIQNPGQTGTWQAVVSYDGVLTNSSQAYGLILSGTADTPNTVNIISPNGGETFFHSSTYPISWVSNVVGDVSIELLKAGSLHSVLSANEVNDGSFTWLVPSSLPTGSDYAIRIKSVNNPSYTDNSAATFTITVNPWEEALDITGIPWDSTGAAPWFTQTTVTKDGADAVQSGLIDHNGSSNLEATVTGPGTLTFWWKVSSESNYDFLKFELDGVEQTGSLAKISGNVDWVQKTVTIPAATTTLRWTYYKDNSVSSGSDAAWVDQVVWAPSPAPEIAVEQPVATDLTDGSASINFGSVFTGNSSSALTFTIRNTGNANLTGLTLSKSGAHSADYTLGSLGATTLAPGASTTFTATFSPSAVGARTATIQIANNDSNENPFDINLTGTGLSVGTLDVTAGGIASTGSYGGPFSPNTKVYTLTNIGTTAIDWTAAKTQSWVTLSATSGTLAAGASTTLTASINSAANSLNAGSYSDTITLTNTTNGNGTTTRAASLTVNPLAATISLGNLLQYYDGSPKPVSVTTTPSNLAHSVTYNGSSTVPSGGGTYAVVATITAPNYAGTASGNLTIVAVVNYVWGGGNLFWNNTTASGWNGGPPLAIDTATINSGTVTFAANDTYGNAANTSSAAITVNTGGTLASGGKFNSLWNLTLGGGTLLSNGGVSADYGTFNLAGTVTASGGVTSSISTGSGSNNLINLGNGSTSALTNTTFNIGAAGTLHVGTILQNHRYHTSSAQTSIAGLIKNGAGVMNLNATNTYTGGTTISEGKLFINGNQTSATGNVSVAANATLGGTGIIGGNTTIAASGRLEFDVSTNAASHNKLELASGKTLTFSGTSTLTITSSGGASAGSYVLVSAPGGIIGNAPANVILPTGWTATVSKVGNDLVLNVTSVTPFGYWATTSGLTGGNAASNADPDGDGVTNLHEFAFGTNPSGGSPGPIRIDQDGKVTSAGLPTIMNFAAPAAAADFRAVFPRRKDYLTAGITYTVEFSADLTLWTASNNGLQVLSSESAGDVDAVSVPYPATVPVNAGGAEQLPKFFRVGVSQN